MESGDTAATMGVKAARIAIFKANLIPKDIDFIIFATMTPDYYFPGCGVQVQAELGIKDIGALDVAAKAGVPVCVVLAST